jgi:DNA-directed RNA polymerase specialized sigma24 family protein
MKTKDDEPLWIPDRDAHGRPVNEQVEVELQNVWSRAAEIMEKTAFTVSRLMRRKVIRNLRAFSYRVFKRKYLRQLRKDSRFVSLETLSERDLVVDCIAPYENELEVKLFLRRLDQRIQTMFSMRSAGYSWKEIGEALGLPPHNAESQFSYRIRRESKKLNENSDRS